MSSDWILIASDVRCHQPPAASSGSATAATATATSPLSASPPTFTNQFGGGGGQLDAVVAQCATARQLHARAAFRRCNTATAMSPEDVRRSQKPYRYGMILLCFGALINWVGLAENYTEPIRYAGVACIVCGALLICTAMCCWLHTPARSAASVGAAADGNEATDADGVDAIHVISMPDAQQRAEKPPEYETCVVLPPSYDDALQLSPAALLAQQLAEPSKQKSLPGSTEVAAEVPGNASVPTYEVATAGAVDQRMQVEGRGPIGTLHVCHVTCTEVPVVVVSR